MLDKSLLYSKIHEIKKTLMSEDSAHIQESFEELQKSVYKNFPALEEMKLFLEYMSVLIDYYISKKDYMFAAYIDSGLGMIFMYFNEYGSYNEEEKKPLIKIFADCHMKVMRFMRNPFSSFDIPETDCVCALCRKNKADKTGSHMVPHFLIQKFFAYDSSSHRNKETVTQGNMGKGTHDEFIARAVPPDEWEKLRDKSVTDEDIEIEKLKQNPLMKDYIFCESCEKRFSVIESLYADIFSGKTKNFDAAIPYLFWVSVIWRMSVGRMGVGMRPKDEEKLRVVLDKSLAEKKEDIVTNIAKLGKFGYCISKAIDMKDENVGITGYHAPESPYEALIGDLHIGFFMSRRQAIKLQKKAKRDVEFVNDGRHPEKIGSLTFLELWKIKQLMQKENREFGRFFKYNPFAPSDLWKTNNLPSLDIPGLDLGGGFENPNVFNEYEYCLSIPRSVEKILLVLKENEGKEGDRSAVIEKETGYTKEEVEYMLQFWHEMADDELGL